MTRSATLFFFAGLLAAAPAAAQTLPPGGTPHAFGAVLSGAQEVPPVATTGRGVVSVVFYDYPAAGPTAQPADLLVVRGAFEDLQGTYADSHLHPGALGAEGGPLQGLTAALSGDNTQGEWLAASNVYFIPHASTLLATLQAEGVYVNVHTTFAGDGEIRGQLRPIPLLDGVVSAQDRQLYQTLATKQNANAGFGPNIDVQEVVYYADDVNGALFLGLRGRLNTGSSDGIGLFIGLSEVAGRPAGQALDCAGAGHFMSGNAGGDFFADFEVDYMLAVNPGGGTTNVYVDAAKWTPTACTSDYLGQTTQDGAVAFGPPDDLANDGGAALFNATAFAFANGVTDGGLEIALPYADLGLAPSSFGPDGPEVARLLASGELTVFAFVVSNNAYFSNVTVPGTATGTEGGGNLGFNPNFGTLAGGPFHATSPLVVAEEAGPEARLDALGAPAPNPARGRARLELRVTHAQAVRVQLVDALGRVVRTVGTAQVAPGAHPVELDLAGLAPGVYVVRVTGETFAASRRLTVVR